MSSMELKSISGKGIKSLALFQKPSLYAIISLSNVNQPTQFQTKNMKKTSVDRSNGENPVWDQPILIDIDSGLHQDLILKFDLKAEALLGDRVVGRAFIPLAYLDFFGAVQHVSYQVKTPVGKANGAINFSYKVDGRETATSQQMVPSSTPAVDYSSPAEGVYPAASFTPPALPVSDYPPQPEATSGYQPTLGMAASGVYPPPATTITYPPPQTSTLDQGDSYPPLPPDVGGYDPPPVYSPQPLTSDQGGSYPPLPPDVGGYYTPPVYPPQPVSECCCGSIPQPAPAYPPQPECCCREIPQPAPAWHYPSAPQPAPGGYHPPPAADVDGHRQQDWDRGLYGYN